MYKRTRRQVLAESLRVFGPVRYDIAGFWHIMINRPRHASLSLRGAEAPDEWHEADGDFVLGMVQAGARTLPF